MKWTRTCFPADHEMQPDGRTCVPVQREIPCKSVPKPKTGKLRCNGKRVGGFYSVGTKCKLHCKRGSEASTEMKKICAPTGNWIGPDSECVPITCPSIPYVPNSRVSPTSCLAGNQVGLRRSRVTRSGELAPFGCFGRFLNEGQNPEFYQVNGLKSANPIFLFRGKLLIFSPSILTFGLA